MRSYDKTYFLILRRGPENLYFQQTCDHTSHALVSSYTVMCAYNGWRRDGFNFVFEQFILNVTSDDNLVHILMAYDWRSCRHNRVKVVQQVYPHDFYVMWYEPSYNDPSIWFWRYSLSLFFSNLFQWYYSFGIWKKVNLGTTNITLCSLLWNDDHQWRSKLYARTHSWTHWKWKQTSGAGPREMGQWLFSIWSLTSQGYQQHLYWLCRISVQFIKGHYHYAYTLLQPSDAPGLYHANWHHCMAMRTKLAETIQ